MNLSALTQTQAAALLSIAPRTLRDWHDVPRNKDGSYPGPALVAYYVAKIAGGGEYDDQRQRLAAAQAEKVEHENAVRRGELADMNDVARAWTDFAVNARAKALARASKLSPQLVNIGDANVIAAALRADTHAFLAELADYEPPADGERRGVGAASGEGDGAAAGPDGQPVGGSQPQAQQRKQRGARRLAD